MRNRHFKLFASNSKFLIVCCIFMIIARSMTTGKYFNRGVMALDSPYIGHVIRETADKIVIFGERNDRYDIPKSEIQMTGRNVLIRLKIDEIAKKYKMKHDD